LKTIEGDITKIKEGIIVHFCNCEGYMSKGLAKTIKQVFPLAYDVYRSSPRELGTYTMAKVGPNLWVCNMITQDLKGKGTQYLAVMKALSTLANSGESFGERIYFPKGVGCGLGRGNIEAIEAMIEFFVPDAILVRL